MMKSHHLHLIIFLLIFYPPTSFQASLAHQCLDNQQSALLKFMNESFSDSSSYYASKLASWKLDTDCCSWKGITCDNATGHVIGLDLSHSEFFGSIDSNSSLFKLNNLQKLDLSGIDLSGNIFGSSYYSDSHVWITTETISSKSSGYQPILILSKFAQLSKLTHLNLAGTQFSGKIPLEMARLTKLVSLDLSFNSLELQSPNLEMLIKNMPGLRELRLDGVDMSSGNDDWLMVLSSALPHLHVLSLSGCKISGPIDSSLSNLHLLSELNLSNNNFSSEVPDFSENSTSLMSIELSNCGLSGEFPTNIFRLPNLQNLDISHNPDLLGSLPQFTQQSALRILSLSSTKFYGKLPESIGNLKFLTDLLIDGCSFSGSIPNSVSKLTQLTWLDLSSNNFSGAVPSTSESMLLNLRYLNLQNNSLDGVINLSLFTLPSLEALLLRHNNFHGLSGEILNMSFPLLHILDLSNNMLNGRIPSMIFELKSLEELNLSSNNFNDTLDLDMFSNLKNLSRLDLSDNPFSMISNSKFTFSQLWSMEMHSCRMTKFPNFLRNIHTLTYLDLSNNKIKGHIPNWIWMGSLTNLNLSFNMLTGLDGPLPEPSSLQLVYLDLHSNKLQGFIPHLSLYATFLDYSDNEFTSVIPNAIFAAYPPNITFFSVSSNKLIGEIPASICTANRLQVLDLSNNNLSGTIPKCLGDVSDSLSVLNLGGNRFYGTMPQTYANSLRTLVFSGNQIEGMLPRSLSDCKLIEVLDLGNNQIYDTFPFWLENLPELRVLVLRSNKFHGPIGRPNTRNAFLKLHVIDLSSNAFTGQLPPEYFHYWNAMMKVEEVNSQLKYLGGKYYQDSVTVTIKGNEILLVRILDIFTCVDLSNNEFGGEIPVSIGELKSLVLLNLSHNNLQSHIPSVLENLHQLESLDLSENRLSGKIPWTLTSLTFLSVLNLAHNTLEGTIPQGGQFNTFSSKSYEGNIGLCGLPLSRKCNDTKEAPPRIQTNLDSESTTNFEWKFVVMGYGCGIVGGLSIGYMLFWSKHGFFSTITLSRRRRRPGNRRRRNRF